MCDLVERQLSSMLGSSAAAWVSAVPTVLEGLLQSPVVEEAPWCLYFVPSMPERLVQRDSSGSHALCSLGAI